MDARPTRTREVFDVLRTSIIQGELAPGSLHSVAELAESLHVSRTPVREALIDLAGRGMVRFERNRGVRVLQMSADDLEEIIAIRVLLEVPTVRQAVRQMTTAALEELESFVRAMEKAAAKHDEASVGALDRAFHHALLLRAGNRRLADYVDRLRDMIRSRGITTAGESRTLQQIAQEHRDLLDLVRAGDAKAVSDAMQAHIAHTREILIAQQRSREAEDLGKKRSREHVPVG
ncbi:MAG TPA: GntR family transcriptional regulator [Candidatus Limnocylindria bacterium]|nr:GntR family transcriptional regulator [Candidatus Limnocylindria bacterium]